MECQVLVVGAGPTGLLLAAELARRGVATVLIDAHDSPLGWDRATVIHARSLELLGSLGLAQRFLDVGVEVHAMQLYSGGEQLGELDLALSGSSYGFDLGLSEEVTESILSDHLDSYGGSVTRGARLADVSEDDGGVVATVARAHGTDQIRAQWIVGCDGFHSTTRRLCGIPFPGHDDPTPWAVFDCALDGWVGRFDANIAFLDDPPIIITALPGRRWRVYQRPTSATSDLFGAARRVIARYARRLSITEPSDAARFVCHTRVASRYRAGRVLVAGDAAHVCSPAEGHGMNTGIQDACNLAWKLALVCSGVAQPAILDSYETERRPIALTVAESGDRVDAAQSITDPGARAARNDAVRARWADPDWRHHEAVASSELDISYAASPIVGGTGNAVLGPGDRLPGAEIVEPRGDQPTRLAELCARAGHTLLLIGRAGTSDTIAASAAEVAMVDPTIVEAIVPLSADDAPPDSVGRLSSEVADRLGIDDLTMLLVRPDQYLGLRHDPPDATALERHVAHLRG